jgi:hypothetical protein
MLQVITLPFVALTINAPVNQPRLVYEVQGGNRQTIQLTQPVSHLQPSQSGVQGDSEDVDYLQPTAHAWQLDSLTLK